MGCLPASRFVLGLDGNAVDARLRISDGDRIALRALRIRACQRPCHLLGVLRAETGKGYGLPRCRQCDIRRKRRLGNAVIRPVHDNRASASLLQQSVNRNHLELGFVGLVRPGQSVDVKAVRIRNAKEGFRPVLVHAVDLIIL